MVKGLLVYASGKTAEIKDAGGQYMYRRETCPTCEQHVGKERRFECHWAHDNAKSNGGVLVYIEVPA